MTSLKTKHRIAQFIYSIILIPFWGLGLLSVNIASMYSVFIVFIATLLTAQYLPTIKARDNKSKFLLLTGPTFYTTIALIFTNKEQYFTLPILWIYLTMLFVILINSRLIIKTSLFFIIATTYSFFIYPKSEFNHSKSQPSIELLKFSKQLNEFAFINAELDTIKLNTSKKMILIETWNESCPPCLKSIQEFQDILLNVENIDFYYLYHPKNVKTPNVEKIFGNSIFKDKKTLLLDSELSFIKDASLKSTPCFLLFNSNGKLVNYWIGYSPNIKKEILRKLKSI